MKGDIIVKKIISLTLALLLLISSTVLIASCDVAAEGISKDAYLNESETSPETEPPVGRIYGNYQIITVTDEATIELVENMWTHKSWQSIGLMSSVDQMKAVFNDKVLAENTYLAEILEKENAVDLLLWRFDKYAHEARVPYEAGKAFMYCLESEIIQARMTEEQKHAVYLIFDAVPSAQEREEMYQ